MHAAIICCVSYILVQSQERFTFANCIHPHNISYNMLMSNFQCKILESLRLMLLIIVFLFSCFGIIKISKSCKIL